MDRDDYAALFWGGEPSIWNELRARLDDETLRATFATAVRTTTLDGLLLDADARDQPGIEACVRECLLRLLADATPLDRDYLGEALWHRGEFVALHRATRADVAACALSSWWPGEFSFDPKATGSGRARQVAAMLASRGVSAPASAARVPGAGPDEIGPIEFVGALPTGSYAARDRLTALVGRRLAEKELIIAMRAFAAACACTVALHLERSHDGAGWSLQCEVGATSSARARSTNDAGWMTMRGRCGSLRSAGDFPIFIVPSAGAVEMTLVFR
jgi:hypothetical protein